MDWGVVLEAVKTVGIYVVVAIGIWKGLPILAQLAGGASGIRGFIAELIISYLVRHKTDILNLIEREGRQRIRVIVKDPDIEDAVINIIRELVEKGFAATPQSPFGGQ